MKRLQNKTCFVTGAAQGIGHSIVEKFLAEGATVIAADIQQNKLDELTPSSKLITLQLDVTDEDAIKSAAGKFADVSVLVNCAGYVANGTLLDCTMLDFKRSIDLNLTSIFTMIAAFLPAMLERKDGSIINIASVVSSVMAAPERFAYGTSKAAVNGLTMSVAKDYASLGIRCNSISPGTTDTPSLHERMEASGDAEIARKQFISRQLMGRLGSAEEIAAVATLLASDEALFMTGSNIIIDGGMSL